MDEQELKVNSWFQKIFCLFCTKKYQHEPISGRYDVHKQRKRRVIDRFCSVHDEDNQNIDTIRIRHFKLENDDNENESVNVNKHFQD